MYAVVRFFLSCISLLHDAMHSSDVCKGNGATKERSGNHFFEQPAAKKMLMWLKKMVWR
jgi:hypothetical protein